MNKKSLIAILIVAAFLALNFLGKTHFRRRNASKAVENILTYWKNNDLASPMSYWEDPKAAPPIQDLFTYEIINQEFSRRDGLYQARITVILYFPIADGLPPSGREWIFELSKKRHGWKVVGFGLQQ